MTHSRMILSSGVKLIGLHGHAGAGKDTVSDFLAATYKNHYQESFACPLKAGLVQMFGIPSVNFSDRELKETADPFWNKSPRSLAQFFGTEIMRKEFGPDFWIRRMYKRLEGLDLLEDDGLYDSADTVVISDVRFQNEYDWIIANQGVIIHLTRDGADGNIGIPNHASEQQLNLHCIERTYSCKNNGTISDLHRNIANIIVSATQF